MSRLNREERTIAVMLSLYCRDHHGTGQDLCADCQHLREYAERRLEKCRFGEAKPTCARCPVHCYRSEMREQVRQVMRYSGPRMTLRHPVMAFMHLIDSRRGITELTTGSDSGGGQTLR
jgi:predicted amidophosphoribosyltransferase